VNQKTPAQLLNDAVDFVPTPKTILFGHHFTTIAGTGPIVGPAIGVIWGWGPAFLWVLLGPIFAGAVHDMMSLVISARNNGKTIGELTNGLISPRVGLFFQILIQMLLWIFIAVLAIVIGLLFDMYPQSVFPIWMEIPIAIWLGYQVYEKKKNLFLTSIIAVGLMYLSVYIGIMFPLSLSPIGAVSPLILWIVILLTYGYFASVMPVQMLLQPRDYINAHELWIALGIIIIGIFIGNPAITAPFFQQVPGAPDFFPSIFIIIACGAISGFHSITSSGTTVRQLNNEKDALFIGYGGMLMEGVLAVVVIIAITAGLTMEGNPQGFSQYYYRWDITAGGGLKAQLKALVEGATNLMKVYGIPEDFGKNVISVFIVSFASTSLDSAIRMQRFGLKELLPTTRYPVIAAIKGNRYILSFLVVIAAFGLCMATRDGKGALLLWPAFGAINQLLAALTLVVATVYLIKNKKNFYITAIPMAFMIVVTFWGTLYNLKSFLDKKEISLIIITVITLVLSSWMIIETGIVLRRTLKPHPNHSTKSF
jgi:carbon starvation protein